MIIHEHERFEAELRRLRPAKPPEDLMARLAAAKPFVHSPGSNTTAKSCRTKRRELFLRWFLPAAATAAAAVLLALWRLDAPLPNTPQKRPNAASIPALIADDIEIGRRLIATFDTVASLPSGEPVRLRCREWLDEVVLRDKTSGVVIEQRTPRFDIVPVSFETY
ncbi:MAG: hypothetical protein HY735_04685 [Verrucomicrobia bacterium]|nr:hypothetical protein [Verrucomicrobiota bacterium]